MGGLSLLAVATGLCLCVVAVVLSSVSLATVWAKNYVEADDDYGLIGDCSLALFARVCCQDTCGYPSAVSELL